MEGTSIFLLRASICGTVRLDSEKAGKSRFVHEQGAELGFSRSACCLARAGVLDVVTSPPGAIQFFPVSWGPREDPGIRSMQTH